MLALFLSGEFLLHVPCWLNHYLGSFSYTSRAGFIFIWGVSLTHPVLASFFIFFFIWGVSLTHPVLALFISGEFLLHIQCRLYFSLGSFSYISHAGSFLFFSFFFSIKGVSLTHPVVASFSPGEFLLHIPCWLLLFSGEFLLHIPCWIYFYLGSFSYTYCADFIFL